mmetsp:Transcript_1572/g.2251  ORF Transcript_1572/g.2251 Transcript_1572/m.2251 type:complete len:369 (-) Transcript_1572:24-1130(-)
MMILVCFLIFFLPALAMGFAIKSIDPPANDRPKIAIVGSGAVGCFYGAKLFETDRYDIIFHMRGDHYKVSKENGLKLTSVGGDVFIPPDKLMCYDKTEDIGKVDWVIMSIKTTGIDATPDLLLPLLRKDSRVMLIMNGLVDDDVIRLLEGQDNDNIDPVLTKCSAVYAGMALLGSNRIGPGHVDCTLPGKLTASLAKSSSNSVDDIKMHKEMVEGLWEHVQGFEFAYDDNYTKARWTKNVWNLPFNGISVAMNGITVDKIVQDEGLRRLAYTIMDETIAIANKDLESRGFSEEDFLGEAEKKQMMDLSDNIGTYKTSTMLDLTNRKPMEVKYLFRRALDRAEKLSVPAPTLNAVVTFIEALQRRHNLF